MPEVKETVAVFDDVKSLQSAIDELQSSGFDRAEISLLAGSEAIEAKLGHMYEKVEELEDDAEVPKSAYVSIEAIGDAEGALIGGLFYIGAVTAIGAVVASGGTLLGILTAAAVAGGASGIVGTTLAAMVGKHHADYLQEQLDRGGLLLWVNTRDAAHVTRATEILKRNSAHDVHTHKLSAAEN